MVPPQVNTDSHGDQLWEYNYGRQVFEPSVEFSKCKFPNSPVPGAQPAHTNYAYATYIV